MTKILVTGGCGYIGSHVVKALRLSGYEVVVLDNLSTGYRESLLGGERLLVGDLKDRALLRSLLKAETFSGILHFAASIVVPDSVRDPLSYYQNNSENVLGLLCVLRDLGLKTPLIFSSTAAVYGEAENGQAFQETDLPSPESPYGFSKFFSEQMIRDMGFAHGLPYVILRYFNVAGADPDGELGQRVENATHLIKVACELVTGQRQEMGIYGTDYPTRDGTCIRDYIHVSDLAQAHVEALKYLLAGGASETLNCGYGDGFTVSEVIQAVEEVSGKPLAAKPSPRRPGDPACVLANVDKIKSLLPWRPRYQDIKAIVAHALQFEAKLLRSR